MNCLSNENRTEISVKATIINKIGKQGETQIFIRFTRNRKSYYIATKYKIQPRDWNTGKGLPIRNNHGLTANIKELVKTIEEYQNQPIGYYISIITENSAFITTLVKL